MVTVRSGCAGLGQNPAGRLNYPGVITVHDVIEYDSRPRIVMELFRGGSGDRRARDAAVLPLIIAAIALGIGSVVVKGLLFLLFVGAVVLIVGLVLLGMRIRRSGKCAGR